MRPSDILLSIFQFLLPPAIILTSLLYTYPAIQGCGFPKAKAAVAACLVDGTPGVKAEIAPFRLLTFADPQLEGVWSPPNERGLQLFNTARWKTEGLGRFRSLFATDVPHVARQYWKRLDLWGNDQYLAFIYRSMYWWTKPTHTVVLGDLLGSQWIPDEEFQARTDRFWNKVFKKGQKVPRSITDMSATIETLGQDPEWSRRLISLVGNHDIGYSGDITGERIRRFEDAFGRVNWDITFRLNDSRVSATPFSKAPELRLVVLNSMNLDTPALEHDYYKQSLDFVIDRLHSSHNEPSASTGTVLLTHIPFHKEAGICVDAPYFSYDDAGRIKEQNHLSPEMSSYILHGLATPGKLGTAVVLNGHDHEGCDTFHHAASSSNKGDDSGAIEWHAERYHARNPEHQSGGIREITVRSMMGSYWGHVGMLSAWFDIDQGSWQFGYASCLAGVQHIWWAIHIFDLIVIGLGISGVAVFFAEDESKYRRPQAGRAPPPGKNKNI